MVLLGLLAFGAAQMATAEAVSLDFLAGRWDLLTADGKVAGSSCVALEGGMLSEVRRDSEGSLPVWFYQSERHGGWTQLFPGPTGALREFTPVSAKGAWPLVLGNEFKLRDGRQAKFRLTLTKLDGRDSQRHLEMSTDAGSTWSTVFDFRYRAAQKAAGARCS